MQETRQELRNLKRVRKKRSRNFIVHGIKEEIGDKDHHCEIYARINTITRLGNNIVMNNEKEKNDIMKALPKLRDSQVSMLFKVSITNDYTITERNK